MIEEEYEDNTAELLVALAEENQTRKILQILSKCSNLEEAKKAVENTIKKIVHKTL
jgi:hypothetical protein